MAAIEIDPGRDHINRRLPSDVFLAIFSSLLDGTDVTDQTLVLTHVCSSWRQLVIASPSLWSKINAAVRHPCVNARTAYWLEHAGECSLSITIDYPEPPAALLHETFQHTDWDQLRRWRDDENQIIEARTDELATLLRGCMGRWENLTLRNIFRSDLSIFFERCSDGPTSQLKNLSILISPDCQKSRSITIPLNFSSSSIAQATFDHCLPTFVTPFSSIETLVLSGIRFTMQTDAVLDVIDSCPCLCTFRLLFTKLGHMQPSSRILTHPRITTLQVHNIFSIHSFLPSLIFPSLEVLDLLAFRWSNSLAVALRSILNACSSSLKTLLLISNLDIEYFPEPVPGPSPPENLICLPNVEKVSLWGPSAFYPRSHLYSLIAQCHFPNVRDLVLEKITPDIVYRLITGASNLTSLALYLIDGFPLHAPTLSIPTLTKLHVEGSHEFLSHLYELPNLDRLGLSDLQWNLGKEVDSKKMLTVPRHMLFPRLGALCLSKVAFSDDDIIWLLDHFPNLQALALHKCQTLSDAFFNVLSAPTFDSVGRTSATLGRWRAPRLREIHIVALPLITSAGVLKFVASRNAPSPFQLESISLGVARAPSRVGGTVALSANKIKAADVDIIRVSHS